jgi:phage terminase large subunit
VEPGAQDIGNAQAVQGNPPPNAIGAEMNWRDNPWFPAILNRKRLADQAKRPDSYDHIWEGDFVGLVEGSYFAKQLSEARAGNGLPAEPDPLMTMRAYWDIGGTGNNADACSIWIVQMVGPRVLVHDYYEVSDSRLQLTSTGCGITATAKPSVFCRTMGKTHDKVFPVTFESELKAAGFEVKVVPNMGRGAALKRIEAVRRLFPNIWFNEATTTAAWRPSEPITRNETRPGRSDLGRCMTGQPRRRRISA